MAISILQRILSWILFRISSPSSQRPVVLQSPVIALPAPAKPEATKEDPMRRVLLSLDEIPTRNPLLLAIMKVESDFDPHVVRFEPGLEEEELYNEPEKWARATGISVNTEKTMQHVSWGLAQILGVTARDHGYQGPLTRLLEPSINIEVATKFLNHQLKRYKDDIPSTISAYNLGTARKKADGSYVNQKYVDAVLKNLTHFQKLLS